MQKLRVFAELVMFAAILMPAVAQDPHSAAQGQTPPLVAPPGTQPLTANKCELFAPGKWRVDRQSRGETRNIAAFGPNMWVALTAIPLRQAEWKSRRSNTREKFKKAKMVEESETVLWYEVSDPSYALTFYIAHYYPTDADNGFLCRIDVYVRSLQNLTQSHDAAGAIVKSLHTLP